MSPLVHKVFVMVSLTFAIGNLSSTSIWIIAQTCVLPSTAQSERSGFLAAGRVIDTWMLLCAVVIGRAETVKALEDTDAILGALVRWFLLEI